MESENLHTCIARCRRAYAELIDATDDCNVSVDAEIELLQKECGSRLNGTDKKNIKKIAKALAAEKSDSLKAEANSMAEMLGQLYGTAGLRHSSVGILRDAFDGVEEVTMLCGDRTVKLTGGK